MLKKNLVFFLVFFLLLLTPVIVYFFEYPTTVEAVQEKVIYDLPYPGILPDHPLYFLKAIRDRLVDWGTRDNLKKAQLYLLYSDKKVAMAQSLVKKGKNALAFSTFSKGEKYFLKIPKLLLEAKKQGSSPPSGFVEKLKLANSKHKEIAESFLKELPQGSTNLVISIIKLNDQIKTQLEKL
ncbi:MAG: DUF5667 domain-containing protein [Microgenomates group bacterium]